MGLNVGSYWEGDGLRNLDRSYGQRLTMEKKHRNFADILQTWTVHLNWERQIHKKWTTSLHGKYTKELW